MNEMDESINAGVEELVERIKQMPDPKFVVAHHSEYRDDVKSARNEEALHLLRTDPAEYFRRTRVQAQWFRPDPEALRLLDEEHRRLARKERHWEWRASVAAALHRVADRIYREDEL